MYTKTFFKQSTSCGKTYGQSKNQHSLTDVHVALWEPIQNRVVVFISDSGDHLQKTHIQLSINKQHIGMIDVKNVEIAEKRKPRAKTQTQWDAQNSFK
jgi:hypothetical protein